MRIYLVFSEPHDAPKYWNEDQYEDTFSSKEKAEAFIESCHDKEYRRYYITEDFVK